MCTEEELSSDSSYVNEICAPDDLIGGDHDNNHESRDKECISSPNEHRDDNDRLVRCMLTRSQRKKGVKNSPNFLTGPVW